MKRFFLIFILFTSMLVSLQAVAEEGKVEIERVSLITCGPGKEIYELEGHTALRLLFTDGTDLSVNWGVFDFNSPNFLYRFVKGETDYKMAVYPFAYFYRQYAEEGRSISERTLNLTAKEKQRLGELIDSTLTIGSPVYRYNYVLDNCATRPVDYVENAIGLPITFNPETGIMAQTATFRDDMEYYHKNYPWYQFGIDLALGSGIDRKITIEEHQFAPIALDRMLDGAYIMHGSNKRTIASSPVILLKETHGAPLGPTLWIFRPLTICWLYFIITLAICISDSRRHRITRWWYSVYYSIATVAGLLLTFLIFVSVHESTSPNWLYLWLNPVCFIGAILIWLKKFNTTVFWWQIVNFVALIALGIIGFCGIQRLNDAFIPLILSDAMLSLSWIYIYQWQKR